MKPLQYSPLSTYYYQSSIQNKITSPPKVDGFQFDYQINSCDTPNVLWGSEKPVKESCLPEHIQMQGTPCTSIWNNSTKRKTIVDNPYNG